MNYKFNDAVMNKREVSQEINRIMLLIMNNEGKFLMTLKDSRLTFPFFNVKKGDFESTIDLIKKDFLKSDEQFEKEPFITIQDYQFRYPLPKGFHINNLLNLNCYIVNNIESIETKDCFFVNLFEINQYLDNHEDNNYYYYDDRILKILISNLLEPKSNMLYDKEYYRNYLVSFYHIPEENTLSQKLNRERYVNMFVGNAVIEDICNNTRYFATHLLDFVEIINDNYAKIYMQSAHGLKNGNKDWYADVIGTYEDNCKIERNISLFILRNLLGFDYKIYLANNYEEYKDDNGNVIGEYFGFPVFYIKGDINKLLDVAIREEKHAFSLKKDL